MTGSRSSNEYPLFLKYFFKIMNPFWWLNKVSRAAILKEREKERKQICFYLNELNHGRFDGLDDITRKKLSRILHYANDHCAYYRDVFHMLDFKINDSKDFTRLPLLDKAIIRKYTREIQSDEISRLDHYIMNTGGSTGEPLEFPVSPHFDDVHQEFFYRIMGYEIGDKIVAFDGSSIPLELRNKNIFWVSSGSDIPYGSLSYSSLYLTSNTIQFYIDHILETSPSILRGYPSFLNDVAVYLISNDIKIPFRVKGVQLTAENAHSWQLDNIKRAFNTQIYFQYGHSEVAVFGYTTNDTYEYICSPLYGLTEVLNSDGSHVREGEAGEVVVTGFYNFALPFIRYRTGDLAVFNGNQNGVVRLGKIIGRTQDFVFTSDNTKVALTALIFGQHYHAFLNIRKWQLIQDHPGKVRIKIVKGLGYSDSDEAEIAGKFRSICDISVEFEYVDSIQLSKRGKYSFLVQNLSDTI